MLYRLYAKAFAFTLLMLGICACESNGKVHGEVIATQSNQDASIVAKISKANSGATVSFVYHVYLQSSSKDMTEVLRADKVRDISIEWESKDILLLKMACGRIFSFNNFFYALDKQGNVIKEVSVKLDTNGICRDAK